LNFQNNRLNCHDNKVKQSPSFQNPLSVKQPVESTFQQVEFSLSLENRSFSKGLRFNQPWIIIKSELKNSNTSRHTHNQQQGLQAFLLDLETSKQLVQHYEHGL